MRYFVESTWKPSEPFPNSIEDWYAVRQLQAGHIDLATTPKWKENIETKKTFRYGDTHPLDYLRVNSDMTKSLGFWVPDREVAQTWVDECQTRMRPGQIEHILVIEPEEGDDPSQAVLSYTDRLNQGLIQPYVETLLPD